MGETRNDGISLKAVITGLILVVVMIMVFYSQWGDCAVGFWVYNAEISWYYGDAVGAGVMGVFFAVLFGLAIINGVKKMFNLQEMAIIVAMVAIALFTLNTGAGGCYQIRSLYSMAVSIPIGASQSDPVERYWAWIPEVFQPRDPDWWVNDFAMTSMMPPLGTTISLTPFILLFAAILSTGMAGLLVTLFFQRLYMEVEDLPNPFAEMQISLTKYADENSGVKFFTGNKYFIIALVLGLLYGAVSLQTFPGLGAFNYVWYGEPMAWTQGLTFGINMGLSKDLTPLIASPRVPLLVLSSPFHIGWVMMLPLEQVVSYNAGFLVLAVLMPVVAVQMGLFPAWGVGTGFWTYCWDPPLGGAMRTIFPAGAFIALGLYPLISNWRVMLPILKGSKSPEEQGPGISYKMVWLGLIICVIVYVLSYGALGANMPWVHFWYMVLMLMMVPGWVRLFAMTGGDFGASSHAYGEYAWYDSITPVGFRDFIMTSDPSGYPGDGNAMWTYMFYDARFTPGHSAEGTSTGVLNSYKVGSGAGVVSKKMLMVSVLTVVVSVVVGLYSVYFWEGILPHTSGIGLGRMFSGGRYGIGRRIDYLEAAGTFDQYVGDQTLRATEIVQYAGFGIVVVFILSILRSKFTKWPIAPEGFILAALFPSMWWPMFVGMILKYLVVRVGGIEFYNNKVKWIALGLVVGFGVNVAIWGVGYYWTRLGWPV
jgi:hypothetical protein